MTASSLKHEVFQLHKRYIEMSKDQEPKGLGETYQQLIESQRVPEQPSQFYELITLNEDSLQACQRDEKIKLIQSYQYMLENINTYISCEVQDIKNKIESEQLDVVLLQLQEKAVKNEQRTNYVLQKIKQELSQFDKKARLCANLVAQF